jgi:hypothetical protein
VTIIQISHLALRHKLVPSKLVPAIKIIHLVADLVKIISKF